MTASSKQTPIRRRVGAMPPESQIRSPSVDQEVPDAPVYEGAFRQLLPTLPDPSRRMLSAHLQAPGHAMTPEELASVAGYGNHRPVNAAYGRLGRMLGEATGYQPKRLSLHGKECLTFAFADWVDGKWVLYPSVAAALTDLGLDK